MDTHSYSFLRVSSFQGNVKHLFIRYPCGLDCCQFSKYVNLNHDTNLSFKLPNIEINLWKTKPSKNIVRIIDGISCLLRLFFAIKLYNTAFNLQNALLQLKSSALLQKRKYTRYSGNVFNLCCFPNVYFNIWQVKRQRF